MSIKVITDSSCDLPDDVLTRFNIDIVPLRVTFEDGETLLDRYELNSALFISKMRSFKTLPKTSTPDPGMMMASLEKGLSEYGDVLFICLSSGVSSTYQTACLACKMTGSDRVQAFDTLSGSLGTGIMAIKAVQMANQGMNINEITERLTVIRKSSKILFTLDTLENVVKGGRLKRYEGISGDLLRIKPIMTLNDQGTVEVLEKTRGRKRAINRLLDMLGEYAGESVPERIIGVSHLNSLADAQDLALAVKNRYKVQEDIIISDMGATIGTYTGEGSLMLSF